MDAVGRGQPGRDLALDPEEESVCKLARSESGCDLRFKHSRFVRFPPSSLTCQSAAKLKFGIAFFLGSYERGSSALPSGIGGFCRF